MQQKYYNHNIKLWDLKKKLWKEVGICGCYCYDYEMRLKLLFPSDEMPGSPNAMLRSSQQQVTESSNCMTPPPAEHFRFRRKSIRASLKEGTAAAAAANEMSGMAETEADFLSHHRWLHGSSPTSFLLRRSSSVESVEAREENDSLSR